MVELVAYPSRWRIALLLLGALGFVVLGLGIVGAFGPPWVSRHRSLWVAMAWGYFGIIFFGACALNATRMMFETAVLLRIDQNGIWWRRWSDDTIPWSEITQVSIWQYQRQKSIIVHLRDPSRFPGKGILGFAGKANRALTGGDIGITMTGSDRSFDEAMAVIEHYRR